MVKNFKIIGSLAHGSKPKKHHEYVNVVKAKNIVEAISIYRRKLRGVKKNAPVSAVEVL